MSWTRIDDQMHGHHKIKRAWKCRPALGLHVMAMSYSACYDLAGHVPVEFVEEKLPNARERTATVTALVDAGMWETAERGWLIHDWDEYNGGAKTREDIRATKSKAGKKGAAARWGAKPKGGTGVADAIPAAIADANGTEMAPSPSSSQPYPDPSQGEGDTTTCLPVHPNGKRGRDKLRFNADVKAYAAARFPDLPEPDRSQMVQSALRGAVPSPTHESVEAYVRHWLQPESNTERGAA